jgi:hypothetical protein
VFTGCRSGRRASQWWTSAISARQPPSSFFVGTALPRETYSLVGPDGLSGDQLAGIWGEALARTVRYGGDDLAGMEQRMKGMIPSWHAMDLRLMFSRYQTDGAVASASDIARLTALLGPW